MSIQKILRSAGLVVAATAPFVLASVPRTQEIANDTAIYQNLHEVNVQKVKNVDFDKDIGRLSGQEKSYHESLPTSVSDPMERIQKTPYRYHGTKHRARHRSEAS